jgi:hypothetical protein
MKKIFPNGVCEWPTEKHRRTSVTLHLVQCYRVLCRTDISFSVPPHEWGIDGGGDKLESRGVQSTTNLRRPRSQMMVRSTWRNQEYKRRLARE